MANHARYTYIKRFMVARNTTSPIDTLEQGTVEQVQTRKLEVNLDAKEEPLKYKSKRSVDEEPEELDGQNGQPEVVDAAERHHSKKAKQRN
jgi:hypothetical protein